MFDLQEEGAHGSMKLYVLGFISSILLILAAYFIVSKHVFSGPLLTFAVVGLGTVQAMIQFFCFLHLNRESKPRWNLIMFLFMLLIVVVLVIGSLWIMYNLNYRTMSPSDVGFG